MGKPRKNTSNAPVNQGSEALTSVRQSNPFSMSSVQRALNVPELLAQILNFASRSTCTSAARVCKRWRSPALDVVWRTLRALLPLFRLLGDVETDLDGRIGFVDGVTPQDWTRFDDAAPRVWFLFYSLMEEPLSQELVSTVVTVLRLKNRQHLLPNLRKIEWAEAGYPLDLLGCFLSPSLSQLRSLDLQLHGMLHYYPRVVNSLVGVLPLSLAHLRLWHGMGDSLLPSENFPSSSKCLQGVQGILDRHQNLRWLDLGMDFPISSLRRSSLRNLTELDAIHFVSHSQSPYQFAELVVAGCPTLTRLWLGFHASIGLENAPTFAFSDLTPLLDLGNLQDLQLEYSKPIEITPSDVTLMGQHWPNLKIFTVTDSSFKDRGLDTRPMLPLSLLCDMVTAIGGSIEALALPFDLNGAVPPLDHVEKCFPSLKHLGFNGLCLMTFDTVIEVSSFLGAICPSGCQIARYDLVDIRGMDYVEFEDDLLEEGDPGRNGWDELTYAYQAFQRTMKYAAGRR